MRLRAILFAVVVLAGVGAAAYRLAEMATAWFERDTAGQLARRAGCRRPGLGCGRGRRAEA